MEDTILRVPTQLAPSCYTAPQQALGAIFLHSPATSTPNNQSSYSCGYPAEHCHLLQVLAAQ